MWYRAFSSVLLVSSLFVTANSLAIERVRLATHQVYPYHYVENGKVYGDVIRQVKCAFNRMETPFKAEFSDWVDVELRLRTGQLDAIFAVANSER